MKIVHLNTYNNQSGASVAAKRLIQVQLEMGLASQLLYVKGNPADQNYIQLSNAFFNSKVSRIEQGINILSGSAKGFNSNYLSSYKIIESIESLSPDIIHLHWINGGFISIESLSKLQIPIVWTLHDMWAFTGGCHYNGDCTKFRCRCAKCPKVFLKANKDISTFNFERKKKLFTSKNIKFVTPSTWLGREAKSSTLLADSEVYIIPNTIDTKVFYPIEKTIAKSSLNIPLNKKLILFGAINSKSDRRKGFYHIEEVQKKLKYNPDVQFGVFGTAEHLDLDYVNLGVINSEEKMRLVLSAADCLLVPSIQENLSNLILESMACKTPVVAFDIGGNSDIISHKVNGYLATPYSTEDLLNGIEYMFNDEDLGKKARRTIEIKFSKNLVHMEYLKLYKSLVE